MHCLRRRRAGLALNSVQTDKCRVLKRLRQEAAGLVE
jgi:hypothetical protein